MYDMINEIPNSIKSTLETLRKSGLKFDFPEPLVFTGNGTAFYSALMGSQVLNLTKAEWRAVQAFELANYEKCSGGVTVGISHSGITKSTLDALSKAKSNGAHVVGLTHFHDRPISTVADKTIVIGSGPDKSRCHTKTYAASAAAAMELSFEMTAASGNELETVRKQFDSDLLPKLELSILGTESQARIAADNLGNASKIFFAGSGPNRVTAREAALKIKESSFLPAEGMELEEILHGPWATFDDKTLVVLIAPSESPRQRAKDLLAASRKVGSKSIVVSDTLDWEADVIFEIPTIHEYLSPFLCVIPLYFFAYFLSVKKGNNPDYLRYLSPRYWEARQIVFPPGTH